MAKKTRSHGGADIRQRLSSGVPDACSLICGLVNDENAKLELRIKCCEIIFDRVYGRSAQSSQQENELPQVIFIGGEQVEK